MSNINMIKISRHSFVCPYPWNVSAKFHKLRKSAYPINYCYHKNDMIKRQFSFIFQVTPFDFTENNVKITVLLDTLGLANGTGNGERYLRQILKKEDTVDLFLFCTDMTSRRFSDDDARTIRKLTETFGASLWEHALVVLTFANKVYLNAKEITLSSILFNNILTFSKSEYEISNRKFRIFF